MTAVDILLPPWVTADVADLARTVASSLADLGCDVELLTDDRDLSRPERLPVVVGPHEVLPELADRDAERFGAFLGRAVLVGCESPSSTRWAATVPSAARAAAVFDVSDGGVAAYAERGVAAERLALGYLEGLDRWQRRDVDRPVDVLVLGEASEQRTRTVSTLGEVLSPRDVDIRLVRHGAPPTVETLHGDARRELLVRTKVLLVTNNGGDGAFAWQYAMDAICNGCVVVSEETPDFGPLVPGRHFLSGTARSLSILVDRLLDDSASLKALRDDAYRFVREELPLTRSAARLLERATAPPTRGRPAPRTARLLGGSDRGNAGNGTPPPPPSFLTDAITKQNAVLKKLALELRNVRREVSHVSRLIEKPEAPLLVTTTTPATVPDDVAVSVVVTVHNYARFVGEALESVARSEGVTLEIIVIDDASIDGSPQVVRAFMDDHPEIPITLLEQGLNTGVQRARNTALSMARAPMAFILDADNQVYRHGIAKLAQALDADPKAGFAYGIIERFDGGGSVGLMGTEAWSPALLAREHYIDAMALVRIDAWRQVGGYVTDPFLEVGWEDYDLWLSFAGAGLHGVHVREIVARYRIHGVSALTVTALDTGDLMARLRQRHPDFFAERSLDRP